MAAKTAIKVFIIVLFFGIFPFIAGSNEPWAARVQNTHLVIEHKWSLVFPAILFIGFITLLVICMKRKYQMPDFNWLLVLNTLMLLIYLVLLYSRIFSAVVV